MKQLFLSVLCLALFTGCKNETTPSAAAAESTIPADTADTPVTFAEAKYTDIGKKMMGALAKGDVDGWMDAYANNAKYYWASGDSLVGKAAIDKFWRDRRNNVIETLSFKNDIWLPVDVRKPQATEQSGIWLLSWHKVTAKYKGGSTMSQWMHLAYHFDTDGKIDEVVQYIDRVPIMAALPKK